jgi:scpA/B protein
MSEEGIDATIEDPRNELVERLLEYKRFRQMSDELGRRFEENCLIYEKPTEDISIYTENPDEVLNLSMESFISTFKLFLEREKRVAVVKSHYQKVEREKASIESRISFIKNKIKNAIKGGIKRLSLKDLVPNKKSRYDVIVTFASVLQMMKDRQIRAEQDKMYGEISISTEGIDESKEAIDVQ